MQDVPLRLNFIALIILLGLFLGILVSFFLIKKSVREKSANLYMGLLLLSLTLIMFEGWLNYTNYIFMVLWLTNFSEPLNFAISPLVFMFMTSQMGYEFTKKDLWHFIPFAFWLGYCFYFYLEPLEMKFNDNVMVMQVDVPKVAVGTPAYNNDPLKIRQYVNAATIIHVIVYLSAIGSRFYIKTRSVNQNIFKTKNKSIVGLRNTFYHFIGFVFLFLIVKLNFKNDVGDYFLFLYLSYMIVVTVVQIMNDSRYFDKDSTFLQAPVPKYKKSSLADDRKAPILKAIVAQMKEEKYFLRSNASLSGLAKALHESPHHVSQVINEQLNQSFFELLATYRVEEAKNILKSEIGKNLTIEEIAERVGYNSKSAFNSVFKKITSKTPSEYRDS